MNNREIVFTLKVRDDGTAVLAQAGEEFDQLGQEAGDLNLNLEETSQASAKLDEQVEALTGSADKLDRALDSVDVDRLAGSFADLTGNVKTSGQTLDNFFHGMEEGFDRSLDDLTDWSQAGIDLVNRMTQAMTGAFDDFFFNVLKGRFDDLEDVFESFLDSILHAFTSTLAQMAAGGIFTWMNGGSSGAGSSSGGGTGGLINPLTTAGLLGTGGLSSLLPWLTLPLAGYVLGSENNGDSDSAWGAGLGALAGALTLGPIGGVVGGILGGLLGFERGSDYVPETMPAVVHRGERIFNAAQNERLTRAIENLSRAEPSIQITVQGHLVADEAGFSRFAARIGDELHRRNLRRHG